jgi:pyroglutamyl-peptidase
MRNLLVAGFGPFPGTPRNPSADLVRALGRARRPALAETNVHVVVLPTVYAAVERDLQRLIARLKPAAILLCGLAGGADRLRVETRAVNAVSRVHPDAARVIPREHVVRRGAPRELFVNAPVRRLLAAARDAGVPARLSRDAGRYVCNASLFHCLDTARAKQNPPLVTFIHIPQPPSRAKRASSTQRPPMHALVRGGIAILSALAAEARR